MARSVHERLAEVRRRIDALKLEPEADPGVFDAAVARIGGLDAPPPLERLNALDRELDRIGIHTAEDARLLRELGLRTGKVATFARGLGARADEVVDELELATRRAERARAANRLPPGSLSALERGWPRAARAVKTADIFATPDSGDAPEIFSSLPFDDVVAERPQSARVSIAAFWAARARGGDDLAARRRDLDAAHELLLRLGSEFDRDLVRGLRMQVTDAKQRWSEGSPGRSTREVLAQVRRDAARDPRAAYSALRSVYERAIEAGEAEVATAASRALLPFAGTGARLRAALEADRTDRRLAGSPFAGAETRPGDAPEADPSDRALADLVLNADGARERFELAEGCARFFDVEGALGESALVAHAPAEREPTARRVPYPTQRLEFEVASGLHEVRDFVIQDPRTILLDLASNRQLVRAYLDDVPARRPQKLKRTAVRVYVCDASGSMHGARAKFRDAILLAEVNNIREKAQRGEPFDPLYFTFFNDRPSEILRVDDAASATAAIERLLADSPAVGQTDISLALEAAFTSIRSARGTDPYLARATVVLVTDGEDRVDVARLRAVRAPMDELQISMSFIALGEENRDLRSLVRDQRAQGGRAFYMHLSDREILLAPTEFDARFRTLWPKDLPVDAVTADVLAPHLAALEALVEGRSTGLSDDGLGLAFDVMFPSSVADAVKGERGPAPMASRDPQLLRIQDIVDAIAEAAGLAPAEKRARECTVLLRHLLELYGVPIAKYLELLAKSDPRVARAVATIRLQTLSIPG